MNEERALQWEEKEYIPVKPSVNEPTEADKL